MTASAGPARAARSDRQSPSQRAEPGGCKEAARQIERGAAGTSLRILDGRNGKRDRGSRQRQVQKEDRAPSDRVDQHSPEHRPDGAGDRAHRCPNPDGRVRAAHLRMHRPGSQGCSAAGSPRRRLARRVQAATTTCFAAAAQNSEASAKTAMPAISSRLRPKRSPAAPPRSRSALSSSR